MRAIHHPLSGYEPIQGHAFFFRDTYPTERQQEINLSQYMIWSGPRVSEAIALAWEDVDLAAGSVEIRRARVAGQYKVTKTRRSTAR